MEPRRPSYETLEKMILKLEADLADRRAIERELAHLASYSEMAPSPIIETDVHQKIHYVNPAAQQEFPGIEATGFAHPVFDGLPAVLTALKNEEQTLITRPLKIGEKIYDQQISLLDGGPRVRLYFRDITELKRLDQLKTDFVNMVSHELRSPLTTIKASVKMIAEEVLGPISQDQKEVLRLALNNIERFGRLINELLDISKIEAGKLDLENVTFSLRDALAKTVKTLKRPAQEKGLDLILQVDTQVADLVEGDSARLRQIIVNLIGNALKFTSTGGVTLSVQKESQDAGHTTIRFSVIDTGIGIPPDKQKEIFSSFTQADNSITRKYGGTGLGLTISRRLVELLGGRIWVESKPGIGSSFHFTARLGLPAGTKQGDHAPQPTLSLAS